MGRSQRRKMLTQWHSTPGAIFEQGALSPAASADFGTYTPPIGPPGGPLQGSSLAGPPPIGVPVPTITSLVPNTAVHGTGPDLTMIVNGTGFNAGTVIFFNGGAEKTTFISDTQVSTGVKPSLVGQAIAVPVWVSNIIHESNSMNFTFT